jgi:nucleotide-binding universal stress UspA family protein
MHNKEYSTVVVGVAFSPNLQANVFEALRMSVFFRATLVMVHVGEKTSEKEAVLTKIISGFEGHPHDIRVFWRAGNPVEVLLNACNSEQADLLILGAIKREGLLKYYLGSVARKITRNAPCDVLLLIKPSVNRVACATGVVNGLAHPKTEETIARAFYVLSSLGAQKLTIVEEIPEDSVAIKVDDDRSLRKSTIAKERIKLRENSRVQLLLNNIPDKVKETLEIIVQPIFGRRGYSIGHFARVRRADLLIMNAPNKLTVWDRLFPHDLEYILSDLPTDVLIVR